MNKVYIILFLLAFVKLSSAQAQTNNNELTDTVFVADVMPEYPGGNEEMARFIMKNIRYPEIAKDNGIKGKVIIEFVVDKDGYVADVTIKKGIGGGCDEEAMRIVKKMPQWKPATHNGKPINVKMVLPINFSLH